MKQSGIWGIHTLVGGGCTVYQHSTYIARCTRDKLHFEEFFLLMRVNSADEGCMCVRFDRLICPRWNTIATVFFFIRFFVSNRIYLWFVDLHILICILMKKNWKHAMRVTTIQSLAIGHFPIQIQFFRINNPDDGGPLVEYTVYAEIMIIWNALGQYVRLNAARTQRNERNLNYSILIENHAMHIFLSISGVAFLFRFYHFLWSNNFWAWALFFFLSCARTASRSKFRRFYGRRCRTRVLRNYFFFTVLSFIGWTVRESDWMRKSASMALTARFFFFVVFSFWPCKWHLEFCMAVVNWRDKNIFYQYNWLYKLFLPWVRFDWNVKCECVCSIIPTHTLFGMGNTIISNFLT